MSCHVAELRNIVNGLTCMLCDAMCFDMRIDPGSIVVYVMREVLMSDQSYCITVACESHVRISVGEDSRQWVEAIGVSNA